MPKRPPWVPMDEKVNETRERVVIDCYPRLARIKTSMKNPGIVKKGRSTLRQACYQG
jgi:hypothetical protein